MTTKVDLSKRNTLKTAAALGLASMSTGAVSLLPRPAIAQSRKVVLQTGTPTSYIDMGEIVAAKMGYYKEAGFDLTLSPGSFNNDGIAAVATGQAQFGKFSSSPAIMLARSSGMPIKCIAAGMQKHPFAFVSTKRRPIQKAADFIGAKIATQPTSRPLINAVIKLNGLDASKVIVENMAFDLNQLIVGQVDCATAWATNVAVYKPLGDNAVNLLLWDLGVRLYASVYYVSDDTLKNNFNLAKDFLSATGRGWEYAQKNPDAACGMIVEDYPMLDRAIQLESLPRALSFTFDANTKAKGWGTMDVEAWKAQLKLYADIGEFRDNPVPKLEDVVTTAVLDATANERPRI